MRKHFLFLLLIILILPLSSACAKASRSSSAPLYVYYAGPDGSVLTALKLAPGFTLTTAQTKADVLIFNGSDKSGPGITQTHPSEYDLSTAADRLRQGVGVVLLLGPDLTGAQLSEVVGAAINLEVRKDPLSLVSAGKGGSGGDPLLNNIVWTSSPQVRERWFFPVNPPAFQPIVTGFEDGSLVLGFATIGKGRLFVFTPFLNGANPQIQDWAYFNYLIYALVERAAGRNPLSFADYPVSPVPQ